MRVRWRNQASRAGGIVAAIALLLLTGCLGDGEQTSPADPQRDTLMETGVELYRQGQYTEAAHQFERALDRARLTHTPGKTFTAAYHAAATYHRLRDPVSAQRMLDVALAAADEAGPAIDRAPAHLLQADLLRLRGQPGPALEAVDAGLAATPSAATAGLLHLVRAQALADTQNIAAAEAEMQQARQAWPKIRREPGWSHVTGQRALLRHRPAEAAAAFEEEADRAGDRLDVATVAEALDHAAAAHAQAGQWRDAAEQWLAAARSAQQQPNLKGRATTWLQQARTAAQRANAPDLLDQIQRATAP